MVLLKKLAIEWREEAETLRVRYGDEQKAKLCEIHAEELELRMRASDDNSVTLMEAAEISGYSKSHLRRLLDDGVLTNVGTPGHPRVLIGQLPMKPLRGAGAHAVRAAEKAAAERAMSQPSDGFRIVA